MEPLTAIKAGIAAFNLWTQNKLGAKLFPRWAARRARKKAMQSWAAEHPDEVLEPFHEAYKEVQLDKLKQIFGALRTSTKGGAAGLLAPLVVAVPFYDEINAYVVQACQSEDGPLVFLAGAAITWVSFYITARVSKTPANPGPL